MAGKAASGAGSIRKRTVTKNGKSYSYWEGRITVGYNPGTGKPIVRSFSGNTQKEVKQKLQETAVALNNGTYQEPNKMTVGEWMDKWLEKFATPHIKPLTVAAYQASIKHHIKPGIGAMKLQSVKGIHIQEIYDSMKEQGLSAKTIKNVGAIMHKAFSVAVLQGFITVNPCDAAQFFKVERQEIVPLADEQIPLFLTAIQQDPFCNAYALCLFAGLREGECLGLSWEQVDFETQRITVSQQLQREKKKGGVHYIANTTKNGKARTIAPPPIAFQYLRAEKKRQLENRLRTGELWNNEHNLVFTTEAGGFINILTFYKHFKNIAASIGCPSARPHDLRHTCATVAVASGADIKSVQDLLGHATASFTLDVYTHASDKMKSDTAARMQSYYDSLQKLKQG